MQRITKEESALRGMSKRHVVTLLLASLALQALAFAVPGDTYGLICRGIGAALLVAALVAAIRSNMHGKSFISVGVGVVAGLSTICLVATQAPLARAADSAAPSSSEEKTVFYSEPDLRAIANTNRLLVELKGGVRKSWLF